MEPGIAADTAFRKLRQGLDNTLAKRSSELPDAKSTRSYWKYLQRNLSTDAISKTMASTLLKVFQEASEAVEKAKTTDASSGTKRGRFVAEALRQRTRTVMQGSRGGPAAKGKRARARAR